MVPPNKVKIVLTTPKGRVVRVTRLYEGSVGIQSIGEQDACLVYENGVKQIARFGESAFDRHVPISTGGRDHSRGD